MIKFEIGQSAYKYKNESLQLPCLIADMPNEDYHGDRSFISASWLKERKKSLYHFSMAPNAPKKDSDALKFGSMVHKYLQERETFSDEYVVFKKSNLPFPDSTMQKKENAEYYKNLLDQGKEVISEQEWQTLLDVTDNVIKDEWVQKFISMGTIESSIFFVDPDSGLPVKVRPDNHFFAKSSFGDGIWVLDLKTCDDASPRGVAKSITNFDYPIQAAMQVDGLQAYYQKDVVMYLYLFVEKKFPYAYGLYSLDLSSDLEVGRSRYKKYLSDIRIAHDAGKWPSYSGDHSSNQMGIIDVSLPSWFYTE